MLPIPAIGLKAKSEARPNFCKSPDRYVVLDLAACRTHRSRQRKFLPPPWGPGGAARLLLFSPSAARLPRRRRPLGPLPSPPRLWPPRLPEHGRLPEVPQSHKGQLCLENIRFHEIILLICRTSSSGCGFCLRRLTCSTRSVPFSRFSRAKAPCLWRNPRARQARGAVPPVW